MDGNDAPWWERRWGVAALALLAALPLLWPGIPPLVDLPGHMGRYRVELDMASSPALQHFYSFQWGIIGNLGVDLLILPMAKIFGLELAVKLIVLAIPVMTVAGFLWVAREVHGRVPPTALFAVPFAYGHPFIFGFVNFSLSMAFALLAFALWLRLARLGHVWLRAALFVPIAIAIWFTHTFGWGTLGVMAFSAELIRQHDKGRRFLEAGVRAGVHCLSIAPPVLFMLLWRSGHHVGGQTGDWFNWHAKYLWLIMALRDRWFAFDLASVTIVLLLIVAGVRSERLGFSRNLAASALFLVLVYILLPRIIFGSAYADMRLVPYLLAIAVIAIRLREGAGRPFARRLALGASLFVLVRIGANTLSFWMYDQTYERELAAVEHLPVGARLVTFVGVPCRPSWRMSRVEHLAGIALERRLAYANDQWLMPGGQLLSSRIPGADGYAYDPSQQTGADVCRGEEWRSLDASLAGFPRQAFDYVWLIQPPRYDKRLTAGLQPIWRSGTSVLYRVVDRTPLQTLAKAPS
ncbi:MAG TPA: hypothetical protein VGD66_02720 [Allosphingosinicella sp.]